MNPHTELIIVTLSALVGVTVFGFIGELVPSLVVPAVTVALLITPLWWCYHRRWVRRHAVWLGLAEQPSSSAAPALEPHSITGSVSAGAGTGSRDATPRDRGPTPADHIL